MRRLIFSDAAKADLIGLRGVIAVDRPRAAARVAQRLASACEGLRDFPHIGRRSRGERLYELVTIPPYVVLYAFDDDVVQVERIIHGARLR